MAHTYDGSNPLQREQGTTHAVAACRRGEVVAVNVDGAYVLIADAFSRRGVEQLATLRGRPGMNMPVLVGRSDTVDGIALLRGESAVVARDLMRDCWPGPLTVAALVQPSLPWSCTPDGVVAMRMPLHPWTLDLVRALGPTAYVPAQPAGGAPIETIAEVEAIYGDGVGTYLDGGPCLPGQSPSIVDVTGEDAVFVREGAFRFDYLVGIAPLLLNGLASD